MISWRGVARRAAAGLLALLPLACAPARWHTETAFTAPAKLNGCAIGDLDPRRAGNEIATVCANGDVYLVHRAGASWKHEKVAHLPGEMIQCAIGDVDPVHEGSELVVAGMKRGEERDDAPGAAHVIRLDGDAWKAEPLLETDALIHGVCVADLDPDRPGNEVLCVGFPARATVVGRDGDAWKTVAIIALEGAGKTAVPYRGGAAVTCKSGALLHVHRAGGWKAEVLDRAPGGQARIATDGARILTGRDDGGLGLLDAQGRTDIYSESQRLRGAVLADLDPDSAGLEAATAGYSGKVTVLHPGKDGWRATTVFEDTGKFHHLTSGELPGCGDGVELAGCGYSKRLTVIFRGP